MNKFNQTYKTIIEGIGGQAYTDNGIYDLFMDIVLEEVQMMIKKVVPIVPQIIYEKTYVVLFWTDGNDITTKVLIDETGQVVVNVVTKDDELIYENSSIKFLTVSDIQSEEFLNVLIEADAKAETHN